MKIFFKTHSSYSMILDTNFMWKRKFQKLLMFPQEEFQPNMLGPYQIICSIQLLWVKQGCDVVTCKEAT